MEEEFKFKEKKDELTINEQLLIQLIDSNTISEELNDKLEDLSDKFDTYNEHLATKNILLYVTSIILFGILCAIIFI